jgi:TRAP transporter 4TM/12TM fusion protein
VNTDVARPGEDRAGEDPGRDTVRDAGPDSTTGAASAEELIATYDAERPARRLGGPVAFGMAAVGFGLSLYALYWVFRPLPVLQYRMSFLAVVLPLTFLAYRPRAARPGARRLKDRDNPGPADWLLAAAALVACAYPLFVFDALLRRTFDPTPLDLAMGVLTVVLVLEAARRTVGWILPAVCGAFLAYAYYGSYIPAGWQVGHRGYGVERLVEAMYMGTEGIYGVPLDVAATYIVLFTIYGAVLDYSGAGQFFVDISLAAFRRSRTAPGRTVTMAGFLLGTVSGSGVATTVSVGSVAWPILRRAGYPREQAGGVMAAAGIGAILSPPTLGAAAFIIAEFLDVSYLRVLLFATVPTLLYYLGILLAIEMDARRFGTRAVTVEVPPFWRLLGRFGYHFSSLFLIVGLMALGQSPFRAVAYATVLAGLLSFLDRRHRLTPRRAAQALAAGAAGVLPVAATCAAAGVIVAVVTLTGLGLKTSSLIVDVAGGSLALTALLAALAVLILGLAVPVTASFIIAWVIIGPALITLGVGEAQAAMFVFYYAVLSEVSPPTALSAVAASAITGGDAYRTMMQTWKYTLPAFLVPFAFVLAPGGAALLGEAPFGDVVLATAVSAVAVAMLAVATGGWLVGPAGVPVRLLCAAAALALLYLRPGTVAAGLALGAAAVGLHLLLRRMTRDPLTPGGTP